MGGNSSERKISLKTGNQVLNSFQKKNYNVKKFVIGKNLKKFVRDIIEFSPNKVFNALHGKFGEDGQVQSILNTLKIPYTHSGACTSSIAMNKYFSKIIFGNFGIPCPKGILIEKNTKFTLKIPFPLVLKPVDGGSSIDVLLIKNNKELVSKLNKFFSSNKIGMLEEFIPGREITVGVLDNKILGSIEIISNESFYNYKSKYISVAKHVLSPELPKHIKKKLIDYTLIAHKSIGCNYLSRADFKYNEKQNQVYLLEINTQPGLTKNSLLPEMAADIGINFDELCRKIVENARCE